MSSDLVFPVARHYVLATPETDTIEPIAVLASEADTQEAFRVCRLRVVGLGLGFDGAYLVESAVDRDHQWVLGGVQRFDRFVEALAALAPEQHVALGVTSARLAALASCDELRRVLAAGELAKARALGESALRGVRDAFAVTSLVGEAKLKRPIVRTPVDLARLCEQALACCIHDASEGAGRMQQVLYLAADLAGGPRAAHETRDDRGRRTAFESVAAGADFAAIALPCGVVHPARWADAAARLGMTIEEAKLRLCGREDDETYDGDAGHGEPDEAEDANASPRGPRAAVAELGEDLLVHTIPEIPEDERAKLYVPKLTRFAGTTEIEDPLSRLYESLYARIRRIERLLELGAPDIIIDSDASALQRTVELLAQAAREPLDVTALDGWGSTRGARRERIVLPYRGREPSPDDEIDDESDRNDDDAIASLLWLTDDRILVAWRQVAHVISIAARRVVRSIELGPVELQACDDSGRYALTTAHSPMVEADATFGVGCLDTETGTWLAELPAHIPAVSFGGDQPEDGVLYEHRRSEAFEVGGGDRPTAMCFARGNHAVLLSADYHDLAAHGIRSTHTCTECISVEALEARAVSAPILLADGTLAEPSADACDRIDLAMGERWGERYYRARPSAIAQVDGRWRFLLPTLHIGDLERTYCKLGFVIDAAAFSPDGRRLLVADGQQLSIVDIADRAIAWRAALDQLASG